MRRLLPGSSSQPRLIRLDQFHNPVFFPPVIPEGLRARLVKIEDSAPFPPVLVERREPSGSFVRLYLEDEDGWENFLNFACLNYLNLSAAEVRVRPSGKDYTSLATLVKRRWLATFLPEPEDGEEPLEEAEEEEEDDYPPEEDVDNTWTPTPPRTLHPPRARPMTATEATLAGVDWLGAAAAVDLEAREVNQVTTATTIPFTYTEPFEPFDPGPTFTVGRPRRGRP